ncbi:GlxA family transcriptional regulator [Rhodococcus sp. WAY2]|uniref:GlxA family transcriptional regulator n=1 Tax=Rhodococcus sp. WAY2 TaxID=2663121 RepID=UPI00131F5322|nr:helix-turn-helix domain-containing protein [Rhodococcus sp. WAY2]QHE66615.1 Transcriptional regulator containing an amidase domain and an AraC-type DNA-binding HTH domain [Rhodococcus sp. WAY2]
MVERHRVVVLALDGVIPFELGIPSRVFGRAHDADGNSLYEVQTCTADGRPVRSDADFSISVDHGPELLAEADTVVIPASYELGPAYDEGHLPPNIEAALAFVRPGTRYVSICTGSYILAAAGLLDGLRATTHWRNTEHFQRTYPKVRVDPDVLFVDEGQILTSAGVAAGLDLCLHILRRDHGSDLANQVARRCVVPPWRDGGQAQYIERPIPAAGAESTAATRNWALERLGESLTLTRMAAHSNMSVRTFTRRFGEEVGTTPNRWLITHRVDRARQLLETTDLSVDVIAREVGFGTTASLRQHMGAVLGVPPSAYRKTFRGRRIPHTERRSSLLT